MSSSRSSSLPCSCTDCCKTPEAMPAPRRSRPMGSQPRQAASTIEAVSSPPPAAHDRSFGLAHAAEHYGHVGPEALPLLALRIRQPREAVLCSDSGKGRVGLPVPHPPTDIAPGLSVALGEFLAPPGKVE